MQKTVITSQPDSFAVFVKKLWQYRGLIWAFAERDIKVKYAQTWLGLGWSLVQPLVALLIFSVVLGYLFDWKVGELPYTLHLLSGIIGWNFFSYVVNTGSGSIQESAHIIKKIYFPKSILPLSKVLVGAVEMLIAFLLLIPLMVYFGQYPTWKILLLPLVIFFNALCALALVFWIAAIAFRKRDFFHILPFIIYFGVWLTPVFFSIDFYPDTIKNLVKYNPMTSVVEFWRFILFNHGSAQFIWFFHFLIMCFTTVAGAFIFNKTEAKFSDFA